MPNVLVITIPPGHFLTAVDPVQFGPFNGYSRSELRVVCKWAVVYDPNNRPGGALSVTPIYRLVALNHKMLSAFDNQDECDPNENPCGAFRFCRCGRPGSS